MEDLITRELKRTKSMKRALAIAEMFLESENCPTHHQNSHPVDVLVCLYKGIDIGLDLAQSLTGIIPMGEYGYVIKGDVGLALIKKKANLILYEKIETGSIETHDYKVVIRSQVEGSSVRESSYSYSQAVRAQLIAGTIPSTEWWTRYAERMIHYKALGFHLRDWYSEFIGGLHIFEELENERLLVNTKAMKSNAVILKMIKERMTQKN